MGQFKPMPKMETTEPSVILKLKKGGTVKKADGGALPIRNEGRVAGARAPALAAQMAQGRGRAALMGAPSMSRPAPGMPAQAMGRKKGGVMESAAHEAKEEREMASIKKELKSHESKPASKGHKGLKTGGVAQKYKKGGKACMADGGDVPSAADIEKMKQQLAEQKMDEETDRGYNRFYGEKTMPKPRTISPKTVTPPPALPLNKKTGGVMKKFADGGHCSMKSGGEGFKVGKKMSTW